MTTLCLQAQESGLYSRRPYETERSGKALPHTLTFADALRYNDGDLARHLIAEGLDPNSRESDGRPLLLAGLRDRERRLAYQAPVFDEAAVQTLLRDLEAAGISIPTPAEWPHEYRIPRTHAMAAMDILIEHGDPALLKRLLETGVNPNEPLYQHDDDEIVLPLCEALHGHAALVPVLLEYGADPSGDGEDAIPLMEAFRWSDDSQALVELLPDAGASPFLIPGDCVTWDTDGQSPLYMAEYEFRSNARLPYREAEDKRRRKHSRRVPENIYERYPDIDRLPSPDHWEPHTDNPAYFNASLRNTAAYGLRESAVTLLHYHNASPNACNRAGIPALVIAAARGHADVVYELLCYGATPELPAPLLSAVGRQSDVHEEIRRLIRCFSPS